jgi:hypothetical protein
MTDNQYINTLYSRTKIYRKGYQRGLGYTRLHTKLTTDHMSQEGLTRFIDDCARLGLSRDGQRIKVEQTFGRIESVTLEVNSPEDRHTLAKLVAPDKESYLRLIQKDATLGIKIIHEERQNHRLNTQDVRKVFDMLQKKGVVPSKTSKKK